MGKIHKRLSRSMLAVSAIGFFLTGCGNTDASKTEEGGFPSFENWTPPEGTTPGSPAAKALYEMHKLPASDASRAALKLRITDENLNQEWDGLPRPALGDCEAAGEHDNMCVTGQNAFIDNWSDAWAGHKSAMSDVAFCFSNGCDGSVIPDPVQACAWRSAVSSAKSNLVGQIERDATEKACSALTQDQKGVVITMLPTLPKTLQ